MTTHYPELEPIPRPDVEVISHEGTLTVLSVNGATVRITDAIPSSPAGVGDKSMPRNVYDILPLDQAQELLRLTLADYEE